MAKWLANPTLKQVVLVTLAWVAAVFLLICITTDFFSKPFQYLKIPPYVGLLVPLTFYMVIANWSYLKRNKKM